MPPSVTPPADASPGVPLSDMIETLRTELQRSVERGAGQSVAFNIDKVELELKVAVSVKAQAEGGVAFWVIKAGAGADRQQDQAHTFKLTLSPVMSATGERTRVHATAQGSDRPGER